MGDDGGVNIRNLLAGQYTPKQIDTIIANAKKLPYQEQVELLQLLEQYEKYLKVQGCQTKFMNFVKEMWPAFIAGRHHSIIADAFERVANGSCKRLIINLPPRHSKSEFSSYLLPAWYLGKYPDKKIIQTAHTAELAVGFGRKVRNLVGNPHYQSIFPGVSLSSDSKAAGRWNTNKGGEYFAIGVGGAVTGKGADCAYFSCKCLTRNGMIPIAQVKVGQEVYGYNHELGRPEWTRVLAVSTQYKPELVSVGGFVCTPDHRIYDGSGYAKATEARRATVLPMWEELSSSQEGIRKLAEEKGYYERVEVLLLEQLPGGRGNLQQVSPLRGVEGADGESVQGLLPEGQACEGQLHALQEGLHEGFCGVQEGGGKKREPESLLHKRVLRGLEGYEAEKASASHRDVQYLQIPLPGEEEVLQHGVLLEEEGQERHLRRGVELKEALRQEEGQRNLRLLPENQGESGCTPHQPRRDGQQAGEPDTSLRTVSQPLSSHSVGTCAEDLKVLLRGSGHWVVDIQTESENFFCEGVLAHNCLIIDDPHSEQEAAIAATNPDVYDGVYEWYTSGPRQRLQPGGAIVILMTRWSKRDLCGQILKASAQRGGDEWEVIEFPAIMPSGNPLWPEFWSLEELDKIKAELPVGKWNAQYQQNPTSEEGALVKREWWKIWEADDPPQCDYIIQSWDTALTKGTRSDYSACTTWGVFYDKDADGKKRTNIIILNAYQDKLEFPELKQKALEEYKYWKPDTCIIEAKAAGAPLVFEMRKMGIPIQDYTPSRGNDKIARVNAVSDIFASGFVYAPPLRWAEEVIEQFASFPNSDHDDLVDSSTQALLRFRQGGFISTQSDEDEAPIHRKKADYY